MPFKGRSAGVITNVGSDPNIVELHVTGTGLATHLGHFTWNATFPRRGQGPDAMEAGSVDEPRFALHHVDTAGVMTEQDGKLDPIQEGFMQEHGLQCGFCTPGMMLTSYALLRRNKRPNEDQIRHAISGNLCRCTGYVNIVKAVQYAAAKQQ